MVEQHILSVLQVLALVCPEQAYYFYQRYIEGYDIQDIARSCGKTTKTVQRGLHGWTHKKGEELGAEDWFIILLQLFFEAECLVGATDALTLCFSEAVSGSDNLLYAPFHRGFFQVLVNALDPHDPADSLPWTKAASQHQPDPYTLRHIGLWQRLVNYPHTEQYPTEQ